MIQHAISFVLLWFIYIFWGNSDHLKVAAVGLGVWVLVFEKLGTVVGAGLVVVIGFYCLLRANDLVQIWIT